MNRYVPETPFRCEDGLVYNLKTIRWRKGKQEKDNDIAIAINGQYPPAVIAEIAQTICDELNRQYPVGETLTISPGNPT